MEAATYETEVGAVALTPNSEELAYVIKKGLKGQTDLTEVFEAVEAKLFKVNNSISEKKAAPEESIDELLQFALPERLKQFVEFEEFSSNEHGYSAKVYISSMRAVKAVAKFLEVQSNCLSLLYKKDITLWVNVIEEA